MRRSVVWLALPVMIAAAAVAVCLPRFGGSERPKVRDAPVGGAAGHAAADPEPLAPIDPEAPAVGTDAAPTGPQVAPPVPRGTEATPSPTTEAQLREALDRDGVEGLLRALSGMNWGALHEKFGNAPAAALAIIRDDMAAVRIFGVPVATPAVRGPELGVAPWTEGMTIEFPEGAFDFPWPKDGHCPRDVVVKGAGMDRTLLRLRSGSLRSDEIRGLTMLDLTIECPRGHFAARLATMRMERCRVASPGRVVDAQSLAFRAQGCRFEADEILGGDGVARFDDCVLPGDERLVRGHVACLFLRCTFRHAGTKLKEHLEKEPGTRLEECTLDPRPFSNRKLWTINPAWKD